MLCDQLATVDLRRLGEAVGYPGLDEIRRAEEAVALVVDLQRRTTSGAAPPHLADGRGGAPAASRGDGRG